jgi:hypothetical protein
MSPDLSLNLGRRGGKPATNCLSHDTAVGGHDCGCHVGGPLKFPRDRLSVVPYRGGCPDSRTQGSRSYLPNTRLAGVKPVVSCVDNVSKEDDG